MEGQFFLFSALYWKNNSEPTHVGFCMSQPSPRRLCNLFSLFSSPNFTVLPYSPAFVRLCISVKLSFSWPFYVSPIDINCRWKLNTEVMITGKEISPYSYYGGGAPNGSPEATAGKETRQADDCVQSLKKALPLQSYSASLFHLTSLTLFHGFGTSQISSSVRICKRPQSVSYNSDR